MRRTSPTGSGRPTQTTTSAAARIVRAAPNRTGAPGSTQSRSLPSTPNPTSTTVHATALLAQVNTASTEAGRSSLQRSGEGSPTKTRGPDGTPTARPASPTESRCPRAAARTAAASPEVSSISPRCCATDGPTVSASTRRVSEPTDVSATASSIATVVRPGEPMGPHTATMRPKAALGSASCTGGSCGRSAGVNPCSASGSPTRSRPTTVDAPISTSQPAFCSATATHRTWACLNPARTSRSRPRRSPSMTATSMSDVSAAVRSSTTSRQRRVTDPPNDALLTICTTADSTAASVSAVATRRFTRTPQARPPA